MDVIRNADPVAFARRAEPFLLRHEAEHNLPLGNLGALQRQAAAPAHRTPATPQPQQAQGAAGATAPEAWEAPYLATVEHAGAIVAVAVRTPPFRLTLSRIEGDDPAATGAALDRLVDDLVPSHPALSGVVGPAATALAFAERWAARTGRATRRETAMRIYQLDAVTPGAPVPGALRPAAPADLDLVVQWILAFERDIGGQGSESGARRFAESRLRAGQDANGGAGAGGLFLWDLAGATGDPADGDPGAGRRPVSMANAGGATPHGIRINLVYTPPEERRRGYASAAVAAVSQAMLDAGRRFCFLYTDLANPTSNHIYQEIGYRPVADADAYDFLPPDTP